MNQKGFTIIELLVVIFIIGLLSSGLLISHRGISRKYSLDQGIQLMLSDLRKAQQMAMNRVDISGYNDYGISAQVNDNYYIIYGDTNGDNIFQSQPQYEYIKDFLNMGSRNPRCACDNSNNPDCPDVFPATPEDPLVCYDQYRIWVFTISIIYNKQTISSSGDEIIEKIYLPDNVIISNTSPSNKIDVFFKSPDPATYINGDDSVGVLGMITLGISGLLETKTITVTTAGLIQGN